MNGHPAPGGGKASQIGPFGTEQQARESPSARAVYAAFDADPGAGKMHPHNLKILLDACSAAEVTLGEYDRKIVSWLAGWEPATAVVIAGIVRRAADGLDIPPPQEDESTDLATVLAALADAAEYRRDRAALTCPACAGNPAELCEDHAADLDRADAYDALAANLGGAA